MLIPPVPSRPDKYYQTATMISLLESILILTPGYFPSISALCQWRARTAEQNIPLPVEGLLDNGMAVNIELFLAWLVFLLPTFKALVKALGFFLVYLIDRT